MFHPTVCISYTHTTVLPLSPMVTTGLFSISVSLLLLCYIHWFVECFRLYIQAISYSICVSLTDLFHLTWCLPGPSTLLQIASLYSFLWLSSSPYVSFFFCSSVSRHLRSFYVLATVNNAAMSIGVCVSFWTSVIVFFSQIYAQESSICLSPGNPLSNMLGPGFCLGFCHCPC